MADDILDVQITDTNSHTADLVNDDTPESVFQYVSTLDAEVTVTVYGTYEEDTDFSDAVSLGSTTLAAGSNGRDSISENWDRLQIEVVATTAPTSGRILVKQHE